MDEIGFELSATSSSLCNAFPCMSLPSIVIGASALAETAPGLRELLRGGGMTRSESSTVAPFEDAVGRDITPGDDSGCERDGSGLSGLVLSLLDKNPLSRSLGLAVVRVLPSVDLRGIGFSLTRVSSIFVGAETFFSTESF